MNNRELREELANSWERERELCVLIHEFISVSFPDNKDSFSHVFDEYMDCWHSNRFIPTYYYFYNENKKREKKDDK